MWTPWTRHHRNDRTPRHRRSRRSRPSLEAMEGRQLLSTVTFSVTSYTDNGSNSNPLPDTLRWAILQADSLGAGNNAVIVFPHQSAGLVPDIQVESPLPTITVPTDIDGSLLVDTGDAPGPFAQIDGSDAPGAVGLTFAASASGSEVYNLTVTHFTGGGIQVNGASDVTLQQDRIGAETFLVGINSYGTEPEGNGVYGVELVGSSSDTLDDDVISANTYNGVVIMGGSSHDVVENSMIGTDLTGTMTYYDGPDTLGNGTAGGGGNGVVINTGSTDNTLTNDVISGNDGDGVLITGPGTQGNVVEASELGTDITGGATGNVVKSDVISGNTNVGVVLSDPGTSGNTIEGSHIGTDRTGEAALGNAYHGVLILSGASNNLIGGTTPGTGNVISANGYDGIQIDYAGTTGNEVMGNDIGTDATGTRPLGNGRAGVYLWAGASGNVIGGYQAGSGNVISANHQFGVMIDGAGGNTVEGDDIGTDVTGSHPLGNDGPGVMIQAGSSSNEVEFDVISANATFGVEISGTSTTGNWVAFDEIGTNVTGTSNLGNGASGVYLVDTSGNFVWYCTVDYNEGYGLFAIEAGNNSMSLGDAFYGNWYGSEASY